LEPLTAETFTSSPEIATEFPWEGGRGAHKFAVPETRLRGAGARGARTAPATRPHAGARAGQACTVALSRRGAAVASWSEKFWNTSESTWAEGGTRRVRLVRKGGRDVST
jgi:hypothetical protein